jgi:hypothetical protein
MLDLKEIDLAHPFGLVGDRDQLRATLRGLVADSDFLPAKLHWFERNDLSLPLYHNCRELAADSPDLFPAELAARVFEPVTQDVPTAVFRQEIAHVARTLKDAQLPYIFVKGAALLAMVQEYRHRQMVDLDLIIPTCKDLWKVVQTLQGIGYQLNEDKEAHSLKRMAGVKPERVMAKVSLTRTVGDHTVGIDMHAGWFGIGSAVQPEYSIWENTGTVVLYGVPVSVPSPESWFMYNVVHRLAHASVSQRDISDQYAFMSKYAGQMNWTYTNDLLRSYGLLDFTNKLIAMTRERFADLPAIPLEAARGPLSRVLDWGNDRRITGMSQNVTFFLWLPMVYVTHTFQYAKAASAMGRLPVLMWRQLVYCFKIGVVSQQWPGWFTKIVKIAIRRRKGLKNIPSDSGVYTVRVADRPASLNVEGVTVKEFPQDEVSLVYDEKASVVITPLGVHVVSPDLIFTEEQWGHTVSLVTRLLGAA